MLENVSAYLTRLWRAFLGLPEAKDDVLWPLPLTSEDIQDVVQAVDKLTSTPSQKEREGSDPLPFKVIGYRIPDRMNVLVPEKFGAKGPAIRKMCEDLVAEGKMVRVYGAE